MANLTKAQLNTLLHMHEQIDGLSLRLSSHATITLQPAFQTFPNDHVGAASDVEEAIDLLNVAALHLPDTPTLSTITLDDVDALIKQVREQKRTAQEAVEGLTRVRMDLMKLKTGLQCLSLDVQGIGGFELGALVGRENARCTAKEKREQGVREEELRKAGRVRVRAASAPNLAQYA